MLTATNNRRHDLDALRACAMLLGIALHAGLAYATFGWAVTDPSQSEVFNWFFFLVHGFRMQLFFLLSGFFTAMIYQRRGLKFLLNHRLKRVALPLLIFTPILTPLVEWVLRMARTKQGNAEVFNSVTNVPWLETFNFHHLWFLWFLCLMVLAFALISALPKPRISKKWINSPRCLLWLIPLTMLPQLWMTRAYPLYGPESSLNFIPIPYVFFYYAIFYGFGAILYHFGDEVVTKHWKLKLLIALCVLFPSGMLLEWWSLYNVPTLQWVSDLLQVSFSWLMIFACIGLFREKLSQPSPKVRYLSDASYWLYLAHLPLVFGLQLAILDWPLSSWVKFLLVNLFSFSLLLISYHYGVKGKILGKLLNGK
ncbi:MAG: acyltransferase family protein [Rubritalea sp.]|uniref:acyltransferase family protein n=1 Tax=Rubritalea sp. TaxID=2109375 RepID=UPI003242BED1